MTRVLWLVLVGCHGKDDAVSDDDPPDSGLDALFDGAPVWRENPDGAKLVGFVDLATTEPTSVTIDVDDGVSVRSFADPASSTSHSVMVLGLRPETTHDLTVTVTGSHSASAALVVGTEALPESFPRLVVPVVDKTRMEPGVTFIAMGGYMTMYDADGVPAWYMEALTTDIHQVGMTPRGTILMDAGKTFMAELTLTGAIVRQWRADRTVHVPETAIPVDVEALHHDVVELPNGNFLGLSVELRTIVDYPNIAESDPLAPPADASVVGDIVVEFQPDDGVIVHQWPLLDRLDPLRIGYDAIVGDFWEGFYPGDVHDWGHANALSYDPVRDEVMVSLRHQDAVIGLDHQTGDLVWIFAPEANWDPVLFGPKLIRPADPTVTLPYHQHGAKITPAGTLMEFDNGNNRSSAYEPPIPEMTNFSRGLEVAIDHGTNTWSVVYAFGEDLTPSHFSGSQGDCDPLPLTGNVLVTLGNIKNPNIPGVEVFETTRDAVPVVVWDAQAPDAGPGLRPTTYRAERLTDVIPGR